jgi:hypothetical protein
MAESIIKYNVRPDVLDAWLRENFGEQYDAAGAERWSYKVCRRGVVCLCGTSRGPDFEADSGARLSLKDKTAGG